MAVTFTVEDGTGLAGANAYVSESGADDYHLKHLYASSWDAASSGDKQKAIMMATRLVDENMLWDGQAKTTVQALDWPRFDVFDRKGFLLDSDAIPSILADAVSEFARQLVDADRTDETDDRGFKKLTAGSLSLEVDRADRTAILPNVVVRMLAPFGTPASATSIELIRA